MRRKKGKEIDISLTEEEWEEVFEWLDAQPVTSKGVSYVSAAGRFLPCFHIAEYKAGCSRWPIFQRGNISAPGARRASFVTRALPLDCCC